MIRPTLFAALLMVTAAAGAGTDSYYNQGKSKGWFWYEKEPPPPPPVEEEPLKPEPQPQVVIIQRQEQETPQPREEPAGPIPGSSAWLKANMDNYLQKAMDDPTVENVSAYLYLHRLMVDKASVFADNAQIALANEPLLANDIRRPRYSEASAIMTKRASEEQNAIIKQIASGATYVALISGDCETCKPVAVSASTLARQSNARLDVVTMDGGIPPGLDLPAGSVRADPRLVARINPIAVPSIYLIKPGQEPALITASPMAATDMKANLINIAYARQWISPVAYERTRARNDVHIDLNPEQGIPDSVLENPADLVDYLRSQMTFGAK